jgi:pantoate kinase
MIMTSVVTAPIAVAKAFSPGHITGFLEKPPRTNGYLHAGSVGAGFSIDRGISTTVKVFENNQNCYQIMINGKRVKNAEVSRWIVEKYLKYLYQSCYIKVEHEVSIPIGFGLGSSGAAALSLSYALNDALDLRFTSERAAQIAHNAEIACNTGLGTVIAEFTGGFEIRTGIGGPGIGTIEKIRVDDYKAVVLCIEPIYTKSFLNGRFSRSINGLARAMLSKLLVSRCVDDFLNISYDFANRIHLTEGKCKAPLKCLISRNIACSVALFGETIFTLVPKENVKKAVESLEDFHGTLLVCNIDNEGARGI